MRVDKENEYSSFTKLLTKIDIGNLGEYEIKTLKQEHGYLDKLRQQRIKVSVFLCRSKTSNANRISLSWSSMTSWARTSDWRVRV